MTIEKLFMKLVSIAGLLALIIMLTSNTAFSAGWSAAASMNTARGMHSATLLLNGKVLVVGGASTAGSSAELYDPATNTWTSAGIINNSGTDHNAILLPNGKVLAVGAGRTICELYDPDTNNWSYAKPMKTAKISSTATLLFNGKVLIAGYPSSEIYDPATDSWSDAGVPSTSRRYHSATLLSDGSVLVAGGLDGSTSTYVASAERYDPTTNTWSPAGALAGAGGWHTATLLTNGNVLVAGGTSLLSKFQIYDPTNNTWSAASPFSATTSRYHHSATLLPDGMVLVVGGASGVVETLLFNPATTTWSVSGSITIARRSHSSTLLPNGKVLVAGGMDYAAPSNYLASAELYDLGGGGWSSAFPMTIARRNHSATPLPDGTVLVTGGIGSPSSIPLSSAELYDSTNNSWSYTNNSLATVRGYHSATLLSNGKVLVAGGGGATPFATVELYDPVSKTWSAVASMGAARMYHSATLLKDGRVLVAGGINSSLSSFAAAELYDPVSDTWSPAGSMASARSYHTAILLQNGKVLVQGGGGPGLAAELYDPNAGTSGSWSSLAGSPILGPGHSSTLLPNGSVLVAGGFNSNAYSNSCFLYNTTTDIWSSVGSLLTARAHHSATLLSNGKVLVTGGSGIISSFLASAELYDPVSGTWTAAGTINPARFGHSASLLPNGKVLVAGGGNTILPAFYPNAELFDPGLGFSVNRRPVINSITNSGSKLAVSGSGFRGDSEASSGGTNSSPTNYPLLQMRRIDNSQLSYLASDPLSVNWSAISFTSQEVSSLQSGYYSGTVYVNGIPSLSKMFVIGPAAGVTPSTIDFGPVNQSLSAVQTITISNNGNQGLVVRGFTIAGSDSAMFSIDPVSGTCGSLPATIAVGANCTISATFTPALGGIKSATLKVVSNSTNTTALDVSLTGNGVDTIPPSVSSASSSTINGAYNAGKAINISVNFSEATISTSGLTINLNSGASISTGAWNTGVTSWSGTYTVGAGQTSADLAISSITGTISDMFNNSTTSLAIPAGQNISDSSNIVVDTTQPTVSITSPSDGATLDANALLTLTGSASDAGSGVNSVQLQILNTSTGTYQQPNGSYTSNQALLPAIVNGSAWSYSPPGGVFNDKTTYQLKVFVTDIAGNSANTTSIFTKVPTYESTVTNIKTLAASQSRIAVGNSITINGVIERYSSYNDGFIGKPIYLDIYAPGASTPVTVSTTIASNNGVFSFSNLSSFTIPGSYKLTARFPATTWLQGSSADIYIQVGPKAGYAIVVQGQVLNDAQGAAAYNKTVKRVIDRMKTQGLATDYINGLPQDVRYFSFLNDRTHEPVVKSEIAKAITTWAAQKLATAPAPLYIVLIDHGSPTGQIYLDTENITPSDMAGWLNTLEGSFTQQQLDSLPERIVVVGSCYSGTFISPLSKHGRVIISSAAPTEESARGFIEGDGVMTGEYFVDQLFVRLERGDTFKDAFNAASRDTAMFTRAGTSLVPDPTIIYHDTALQHPLLDDNGDHAGLNQLPDAGTTEGQLAATIRLGIGRQAQISPSVEIVNTTDTIYLTNGQSGLPNGTYLWVELNDPALMNGVPVVKLRSPTTATSGGNGSQITYSLAELQMSTIGTCTRSDGTQTACYHTTDSQSSTGVIKNISVNMFSNPGIYEAYYYAIDKTTLGLSPIRRSVIYKSDGTTIPAPVLVSPGDGTPQKTALVFEWNPVPVATKKITYTLEISTIISGVSTIVHRLEELVDPMVMIPMGVLKDLTTYDWKVSAIDQYGNKGISYIQSFTTNNRNGLPTMIKGYVTDSNGAAVVGATVSGGGSSTTTIAPYGAYLLSTGSSGSVPITASKLTYADQQATASLTPGGVSIVSFRMASNNYLLSVTINGSGTGTVYSTSPSIGAPKDIACATADPSPIVDCQATYPSNSSVTLYPALSWYSKLSSWSGGGCSVAGDCIVPMSSPQSVTATIDQAEFVKLANPAGFYGTIQGAYDKATLGGEIKLRDSSAVTFLEPLIVFNQNYTVTLDGGNDFGWVNSGYSVVKGVLKIQAGRVTVKNLKIMP